MKDVLGGKGAGLAEMTNIGVPVPPGFTISTAVCTYFYEHDKTLSAGAEERGRGESRARSRSPSAASSAIAKKPLLVSVRSGARASMPGMMDTILNLGLNDETVQGLAAVVRRRALRARLLSPLHPDVLRRRAGDRHASISSTSSSRCATRVGVKTDAEIPADGAARARRHVQEASCARSAATTFRRTCTSSSGARSARCSTPGTTSAPSPIAS